MNKYKDKLILLPIFIKQHIVLICFVLFGLTYSFLIFTSSSQASKSPTDAEITERLQASKITKIDDSAAEALQQLIDNNDKIQALFDAAEIDNDRKNPFSE